MIEHYMLNVTIAANALGFAAFVIIYFFTAAPLKNYMGRRVLIFMSLVGLAFSYVFLGRALRHIISVQWLLRGWVLVLGLLAIGVWWAVAVLIKYQIAARRQKQEEEIK